MTKKLYVGNLPFQTTEEDLSDLFSQAGNVESVRIITDRDTGRSRGFGFVEMGDDEADKAVEELNGKDMGGRPLTVNEARPQVNRGGGGGGGGGGRGGGGDGGGYGRY
jgi:RNA recognition motif-containing protein